MAARSLDTFGVIDEETEVLTVGPGNDPLVYRLTGTARRVFATDLDRVEGAWSNTAAGELLVKPELQWPGRWNPRRLVVQPMDPLELRYEDESFGCVCCSGVIEQLADLDHAKRAVDEIFRLIRPGGVASVSTAFRLEGRAPGPAGTLLLDRAELEQVFLREELSWAVADLIDTTVSDETVNDAEGRDGHRWTSVHLLLVKPLYH